MSTHIENEVVSMQFDNKHFESNVRTSLSTLEKLKQSLKLHDAAKGFEDVSKAAKGVNLSPLSGAVDKVGLKFNALYTIADQTLRNIVNSAQRTAKNLVSALTIDPVKTGFSEYELKMGSIQTIMASTGEDLATVNKYLDELNTYSDKTIYSYSDMTTNIGKFTNAGVELEDAVKAIQGISNVAAVSGANANEASRAMYNFAQALSAGHVKLIDWKSIQIANMATMEFKQQLLDAAVAAGTLTKTADGMYQTLEGNTLSAAKHFEDTLQDQWLTTEVLISALGDYADETTEIGKKAFAAAQDIKTFSQMMDTLKESAQSGWAQTWELIFGDFEEGKTLWTSINEVLSGIIESSAKSRNNLLSGALDNSGWNKMIESVDKAGIEVSDFEAEVKKLAKNNKIDIDAMIEEHGSLEKAILHLENPTKILKQAFDNLFSPKGKGDKDGDGLKEYLVKEGDTLSELAEKWGTSVEEIMLLNKHIKDPDLILTGWTIEIPRAIEETGEAAEDATSQVEEFRKALNGVDKVSGRDLLIESFANLWGVIKNITTPMGEAFREVFEPLTSDQIYSGIEKFHGFTEKLLSNESWDDTTKNLKDTFKGIFSLVDIIGKVIGGGLKLGWDILSSVLGHFNLNITDFTAGIGRAITKLNEWLDTGIDKGVGWLIDAVKWLYNLPAVQKFISSFSESWGKFREAVSERWGKGVNAFWDWIDRIKEFDGFNLDNVMAALIDFKDNVLTAFFGTADGGTIFDGLIESVKKFGSVVKSKSSEIWNNIKIWFEGLKELDGFSLENVKKAFIDFYDKVIKPIFVKEDGTTIFDRLVETVRNLWSNVKGWFSKIGIDLDGLKNKILGFLHIDGEFSVGDAWTGLISRLAEIKDGVTSFLGGIIDFFTENKGKILAIASIIGVVLLIKKVFDLARDIVGIALFLPDISNSFEKFVNGLSWSLKATAFRTFAEGIGILIGAFAALLLVPKDELVPAIIAFVTVVGLAAGAFAVVGLVAKQVGIVDFTKFALAMMSISGALFLFGLAAKEFVDIDLGTLGKVGLVLAAFAGLSKFAAKTIFQNNDMIGFGAMVVGFSLSLLLMAKAVENFGKMDEDVIKQGLACIGAILLGFVGLMKASKYLAKAGKDESFVKMGGIFIGMSTALLAIAGAVAIFGIMDTSMLIKGMTAAGICIFAMIGMMTATSKLAKVGKDNSIVKVGSMFAGIGAALLMIAGAVAIFGNMDTKTIVKGGIAVAAFMGMFVGMMAATKLIGSTSSKSKFANVSGMMLAFSASLILIAGAISILSMFDRKDLARSTGVIGAIGLLFVALMHSTKRISPKSVGVIIAMTAAIVILAGTMALLTILDDDELKLAAAAIGGLVGALALLSASLKGSTISLTPRKILGIAGLLAAILVVIGGFVAIGIGQLPTIGDKMSKFMENLSKAGGFMDGMQKLSNLSSANPQLIKDIGNLFAGIGAVMAGASKAAMADWITPGKGVTGEGGALDAATQWVKEVIEVLVDLAPKLNDVSINREALEAVMDAAVMFAQCAAMAPSTTVAAGGFVSKWASGGAAVVQVPQLKRAMEWIKEVVPVLQELATKLVNVEVDSDKLDSITTAAQNLVDAMDNIPSAGGAAGLLKTKGMLAVGGLVTVPMIESAKDFIIGIKDPMLELVSACKTGVDGFDKENFKSIVQGIVDITGAIEEAPSVDLGFIFNKNKTTGLTIAFAFSHPMISALASAIDDIVTPIKALATACSTGITNFNAENFKTIVQGVVDISGAIEESPSFDFGGFFNKQAKGLGWTVGLGASAPLISSLGVAIDAVRDPIIRLANACSGSAGEGDIALVNNFNAENFKAIIQGVVNISNAVKEAPKVDAGLLIGVGNKLAPLIVGGYISHPMVSATADFIEKVTPAIESLANSTATGIDANFNAENFKTIVQAIVDISNVELESVDVGVGFASAHGIIAGGLGVSWPQVSAVATFIDKVKEPIEGLIDATSTGVDKNAFNAENFKSIVDAIVQIASVQFPESTIALAAGGGAGGVLGIFGAGGGLWNHADLDGIVNFINNVRPKIVALANACSGSAAEGDIALIENFNLDNFKAIVEAIVKIANVQPSQRVHWGGGGLSWLGGLVGLVVEGSTEADFGGVVEFINTVKDPITQLATAVSTGCKEWTDSDSTNFKSVVDAIVAIASIDLPTTTTVDTTAFSWLGGIKVSSQEATDFTGFVNFVSQIGPALKTLDTATKDLGLSDENSNISKAVSIIASIATAAKDIPTTELTGMGVIYKKEAGFKEFLKFIGGENGEGGIGESLKDLDESLADFNVENMPKVLSAVTAVSQLASAANNIPLLKEGLFNDEGADWDGFATTIPKLGTAVATFSTNLGDIDAEKAKTAGKAIQYISEALSWISVLDYNVAEDNSWLKDADISGFNEKLTTLATGITDFSNSMEGVNLTPVSTAASFVSSISGLFPSSAGPINYDISGFTLSVDSIKTVITSFITDMAGKDPTTALGYVDSMVTTMSGVATGNFTGAANLVDAIDEFTGTTVSSFIDALNSDPSTAITNLGSIRDVLTGLATCDFSGATTLIATLSEFAGDVVKGFTDAFYYDTAIFDMEQAGVSMVQNVIDGIETKTADATTAGAGIGTAALTPLTAKILKDAFKTAGKNVGAGFVSGIDSKLTDATNAGTALGQAALTAAMAALDEHSPSREFYQVGAFAGIGLVNALNDYRDRTYDAGYDMADSAKTGLSRAISKVRNIIENGVDSQPTIRPVLDLTDISAGASRINSLFGTPSVGVMSNIGTISTMMNGRQNGSNNDVVSAIHDLGGRLGGQTGNTYNINGITYDDGSNITSAVEALIRAAIRERRS